MLSALTVTISTELITALDGMRRESDRGEELSREEAINIIVRDWLQGQGFLEIPGQGKHKTARRAAAVPTGHLDP